MPSGAGTARRDELAISALITGIWGGRERPRACGYTPGVADPTAVIRAIAGSRTLARVAAAYTLFILTEYAVGIAMLVYAYQQGGATTAGLVLIAQAVPASLLAPFIAIVADRCSPARLIIGGYVIQSAAMAVTAIALLSGISPF